MENNQIASIIQKMGIAQLYGNKSSYTKNNAQLNLEGRTHWADDSNLKFFGCRISSAHETASGLLFYVIESSFTNYDKTTRGFRFAIFDIFGEVIARQSMDEAFKTSDKARKAMWATLESFDIAEHYTKALKSIAKRANQESLQALSAIDQITEEATA